MGSATVLPFCALSIFTGELFCDLVLPLLFFVVLLPCAPFRGVLCWDNWRTGEEFDEPAAAGFGAVWLSGAVTRQVWAVVLIWLVSS